MTDQSRQKQDYQELVKTSMEENDKLHSVIQELRACAEKARTTQQEKDIEELGGWLKEFKVVLRSHMDFEEEDGFMQPVVELRPTLSDRVEEIRAEHDALWETINELIRAFEKPGESSFWPRDIPEATLDLLGRIINHEEKENSIVLEVFCDDVGTKD